MIVFQLLIDSYFKLISRFLWTYIATHFFLVVTQTAKYYITTTTRNTINGEEPPCLPDTVAWSNFATDEISIFVFFNAKQRTLQKERKETHSLSWHSSKTLILILMSFSCLGVSALIVSLTGIDNLADGTRRFCRTVRASCLPLEHQFG